MKGLQKFIALVCPLLPTIFYLANKERENVIQLTFLIGVPAAVLGATCYCLNENKAEKRSASRFVEVFFIYASLMLLLTPLLMFVGCLYTYNQIKGRP
jgi:hypothetical protein